MSRDRYVFFFFYTRFFLGFMPRFVLVHGSPYWQFDEHLCLHLSFGTGSTNQNKAFLHRAFIKYHREKNREWRDNFAEWSWIYRSRTCFYCFFQMFMCHDSKFLIFVERKQGPDIYNYYFNIIHLKSGPDFIFLQRFC